MKKHFIYEFKTKEYIPKLPVLSCCCSHPRCNGFYVKVKEDQTSCYLSYVDKKYLTKENNGIIKPLQVINLTKEIYMPIYNEEQKKDIKERTNKAIEVLNELNLAPQAQVSKAIVNTQDGQELFADRVQPYLQDTKYVAEGDIYVEKQEVKGVPTE